MSDPLSEAVTASVRARANLADALGSLNDDQLGTLLDAVGNEAVARMRARAGTLRGRRYADQYAAAVSEVITTWLRGWEQGT